MTRPLRLAFLGCGFITRVHSRHLCLQRGTWQLSYASRSGVDAERLRRRFGGRAAYVGYAAALDDPSVDVVVVAVPPKWHRELTLRALAAGKHVLVEKPAYLTTEEYAEVIRARDDAAVPRTVMVGENDHYKPLVGTLRRLLAEEVVGELVLAQLATVADKPKPRQDWRNDPEIAGGDAFFEEGIHWLNVAGSLGPRIVSATGVAAEVATGRSDEDRRVRSQVVSFRYDTGAVGTLTYSREVPTLTRGLGVSKLYGREGVITFESNGGFVLVHRPGRPPRVVRPGWRDVRGYRAMYADLARSVHAGRQPSMSLERALEDHRLMEQVSRG